MTKEEAILILANYKPYISGLIYFDSDSELIVNNLKISKDIQEVAEAGFLDDIKNFSLAGYSILETALLLGALEHYNQEYSEDQYNFDQLAPTLHRN